MPGILQNAILNANVKLFQTSNTFYIINITYFFVVRKEATIRAYKILCAYPEFTSCTILSEHRCFGGGNKNHECEKMP